jgi:hypothetical protein
VYVSLQAIPTEIIAKRKPAGAGYNYTSM